MSSAHIEVSSSGVAAYIGCAAQANLARFESAKASLIHTRIPYGFNPGDAAGTQRIWTIFLGQYVSNLLFSPVVPNRWHRPYSSDMASSDFHLFVMSIGGIHPGRVEPASPRQNHGDASWVISTPSSSVPVSLHYLALQLKPSLFVRFESAGASALHTLPFGFNSGAEAGTQWIGVLTSLPFVGPFFRSVSAQSTAQPADTHRIPRTWPPMLFIRFAHVSIQKKKTAQTCPNVILF